MGPRGVRGRIGLAALIIAALLTASAHAQIWQWSPAGDHHQAVVLVKTEEAGAIKSGSGCYAQIGDVRGVLTARHVIGSAPAEITWSDGQTTTGREATVDKTNADLAWIVTEHPTIRPLSVAATSPAPGDWVELCGYGGPRDALRHYWGQLSAEAFQNNSSYTCAVMQGDSGGPVLDRQGQVVGVISFGSGQTIGTVGTAQAYGRAGGPSYAITSAFTTRVSQRYAAAAVASCGPSGCAPPIRAGRIPDQYAYPPSPIQKPPSPSPIQKPPLVPIQDPDPPSPPNPSRPIDYDQLAAEVLRRMPPIHVQTYDRHGRMMDEERYAYPGPIKLRYGAVD